jgi:hypothetical protein
MKFLFVLFILLPSYSFAASVPADYALLRGEDFSTPGRDLYEMFMGVSRPNGVHEVNFHHQLKKMWKKKNDRRRGVSGATRNGWESIIIRYKGDKKVTLDQFIAGAERHISIVNQRIDWNGVCREYNLGNERCKLLKAVSTMIKGKDLVAYGLTELMPSTDGQLNIDVLRVLLRSAGEDYVFLIPAMYDRYLSYGFYQFTSYAVNEPRGADASRVNRYLPVGNRIPGSVLKLNNSMQHRAAYLFAIGNIARAIQGLREKDLTVAYLRVKANPRAVTVFVATAHHAPSSAKRSFQAWIQRGGNFRPYLRGRLVQYGRKTFNNLTALEKRL